MQQDILGRLHHKQMLQATAKDLDSLENNMFLGLHMHHLL